MNSCAVLIGESIESSDQALLQRKIDTFIHWVPVVFYIQGQHSPFVLTLKLINKQEDPIQRKALFVFESNQFYLLDLEAQLLT